MKRGRVDKKERGKSKRGKDIYIYIRVMVPGVIGCDCDSFLEYVGHG